MSANRIPYRAGWLEAGSVVSVAPIKVRHDGSATELRVRRTWPSVGAVSVGDPVILYHHGDYRLPELWTMEYATSVRSGRTQHPLRSPNTRPWGRREGWPQVVGVRCDSCRKTTRNRLLFEMHGDERLRDITEPPESAGRIESMGGQPLTMAELDAIERAGFVTHVWSDRDEAHTIAADLASGKLPPGRMMDVESARAALASARYGRILVSCHPRCSVRELPLRRDTLEAAFAYAVAHGLQEISLYDVRQHRRLPAVVG